MGPIVARRRVCFLFSLFSLEIDGVHTAKRSVGEESLFLGEGHLLSRIFSLNLPG